MYIIFYRSLTKEQLQLLSQQLYNAGAYSPSYGKEIKAKPGVEIIDEIEDRKNLEQLRKQNKLGVNEVKEQPFAVSNIHKIFVILFI